ncbi:hypothetical protein MY10362_000507 [Beauveria mimosiformis]
MKSSLALLATAAAASASVIKTVWTVEVVTVFVTVDPTDGVQTSQSISTPTPEPVTTSSAAPSPPSPISAIAEEPQSITTTTTTTEAPPPTSTTEPEPVVQTPTPEPQPETTPEPQPETTTKPQPSSQPEPETPAPADGYQRTAVKYHNAYRENHSAGSLSWDPTLAAYALELAQTCVFAHNTSMGGDDFRFGQNLAMAASSGDLGTMDSAVGKASKDWYAEVADFGNSYGQENPATSAMVGHFTQLVWKNTQKVGCATFKCPPGANFNMPSLYTVCNYSPPGNVQGQYGSNVLPPLGLKVSL